MEAGFKKSPVSYLLTLRLVPLVEMVPDDDGTPYDASVTVSFDDGAEIVRQASEAGMSQLFHDASTAASLFEDRLRRSGYAEGTGTRLAAQVMNAALNEDGLSARQLLDELLNALPTGPGA